MHFETENLDSINVDKEFEITLRGMLAQDESRNTSENIQWGFQRKFEKGDIFTKYKNFMGYDCVDGEIVIVPEQAEVVRKMFQLYLQGLSLGQIKTYLESQRIKTVTGKDICDAKTIQRMLTNEKYKGDTILQKTFTEDFITGCATRIEKGKDSCANSPTLDKEWVQDILGTTLCQNGAYDEGIVRNEVDKMQVFNTFVLIFRKNGLKVKRLF